MKVGIIFGGTGSERESAYAGGRTVYDNLDKSLFEPVPIFVDSLGNFILLDWQHLYKADIRDFYPPTEVIPGSEHHLPVYIESLGNLSPEHQTEIIRRVGEQIFPSDFKHYFDFAFLVLPDSSAGNESVHNILAANNIPHSGPGILAANISSNRLRLKQELANNGFLVAPFRVIAEKNWAEEEQKALFEQLQHEIGFPLVLKPAAQPALWQSTVISENNFNAFAEEMERSLGQKTLCKEKWQALQLNEQLTLISQITHIQTGIGLPVRTQNGTVLHHPEQLFSVINRLFTETNLRKLTLYAAGRKEAGALVEAAPAGINFSCSVVRNGSGTPLAFAPEINLKKEKSSAGLAALASEERTDKNYLTLGQLEQIRLTCQRCFLLLDIAVYACLHGFITESGEIFLDEVQTVPEILPTALVFRQAATIGLNPTQFLTLIIRNSLARHHEILPAQTQFRVLLNQLNGAILEGQQQRQRKTKVGIIMGGDLANADESVAGGRYVYQLLAASEKYHPVPIFRLGPTEQPRYYILPLQLLWQADAEQISKEIIQAQENQWPDDLLEKVRKEADHLTATFAGPQLREPQFIHLEHLKNLVDVVFISLPETEAETGALQAELEKLKLAYSGSDPTGLQLANNKARQQALGQQQSLSVIEELSAKSTDAIEVHSGHLDRELEVTGNLLTRHLPDGRLDYEIFQTMEVPVPAAGINQGQQFVGNKVGSFMPASYSPEQSANQQFLKKVEAHLKKAAQVLNIQSYAQLKVLVRIKETEEVEIAIQKINLFPALTVTAEIFRGAALQGYTSYSFIDRVLQFALERQKKKVHGHRHTEF